MFLGLLAISLLLVVSGLGGLVLAYNYFAGDLPSPDKVVQREVFQSSFIYDRNGELLYEIFDPQGGRRRVVPLTEIPRNLIDATLATEDANFYNHPGFDVRAVLRAAVDNLTGQEIVSGASTITQQLIRNTLMTSEERYSRSYIRKIREIILSYRIEQQYTKDQILEWYLNEINYGNLSYGIEAAAQSYFGKPAKELTLAESAMLAGIPQRPSYYNPLTNLKAAKSRQAEVLDLMGRHGLITAQQIEQAKAAPLRFATQRFDIKAPHFVMYVRELLEKKYGREKLYFDGLRVYTALDYDLYLKAEKAARDHLANIRKLNANDAALVAMDPMTGEVLVMLGSPDYFDAGIFGQVNMATAERQPGSTLKPFAYAAGFERGLTPATVVIDKATEFPGTAGGRPYRPMNHDKAWHGAVTLRRSLASSLNIPAVLVLQHIGIKTFVDYLHAVGITTLDDPKRVGLPIVLGGGEVRLIDLTFAYTTLANNGIQVGSPVPDAEKRPGFDNVEPVSILKVVDSNGNVLDEYKPSAGEHKIRPQIAWLITSILSDDSARAPTYGPNSFLNLSVPSAAKTGTTDDFRDGWTVGYTPNLVTGVWVGNADNSPMTDVYGVSGAGYIWHNFMEQALKGTPPTAFQKPAGIVTATVYAIGPGASGGITPITDYFAENMVPKTRYSEVASYLRPVYTGTNSYGGTPTTSNGSDSLSPSPFLTLLADPPPTPAPTPTPTPRPVAMPTFGVARPPQFSFPTPSSNDQFVTVPDVVGLPEAVARARIEAYLLNNTYPNYQGPGDVPEGTLNRVAPGSVLSQNPGPGTRVLRGTTVYIAVRER
ncbi:MAG: transglycosylase domain-containing protein [Chloroflexi bacterium]|nr:transglycosylase domain-containing protein [Chloroflexota bacterium]